MRNLPYLDPEGRCVRRDAAAAAFVVRAERGGGSFRRLIPCDQGYPRTGRFTKRPQHLQPAVTKSPSDFRKSRCASRAASRGAQGGNRVRFAGNAHELAQRCGMKQSAFARLESGNANPTLETLKRVAEGLGKQLRISFV
ncbi:MAG: helix-turn-helix domain-containing protein [Eggerthella lenta]|nr:MULTISPECIES: helix-turn-helix transcriptional regulator [Eggerthella]